MIQTLDNYGYIESVYLKPRVDNYQVTISSQDHIITIEDDGALLARLGLELVDSTLYLKGYDNEVIAQTDIPLSTGIDSIKYDKKTHIITFVINKVDGGKENYDIDISDLVDLYQSGNGIEITEDEDGNKTINVKINEENKDILSADENGLAIDLSNYVKVDSVSGLENTIIVLRRNLDSEITRSIGEDEELSNLIVNETNRATNKENELTNFISELQVKLDKKANKSEIPTRVSQLENDANYLTHTDIESLATKDELALTNKNLLSLQNNTASAIDTINNNVTSITQNLITSISNETNRAIASENRLQDEIDNLKESVATKDDIERIDDNIGNINNSINTINNDIDNISNSIENISTNLTSEIERATNSENGLNDRINLVDDILSNKVDKIDGKGLSSNDFSNDYKTKLDGLQNMYNFFEESDQILDAKIASLSGVLDNKVELSTYNEKMAEIAQEMAKIEDSIPTVPTNVSEFVNDAKYVDENTLSNYPTMNEMKSICVTEDEYSIYKKDLLDKVASEYATKEEIPYVPSKVSELENDSKYVVESTLDNYYTKQDIDVINTTFATKTELLNGLSEKINTTQGTAIAQDVVNNKLLDYTPTTGISSMIDSAVNTSKGEAITESNTYTDGQITTLLNTVDSKIDTAKNELQGAISLNSNELHILSVCNDGDEYNASKAMSAQGTGVVDETYRLVHKLLADFDENDLSKLNRALKDLIK